MVTKDYVLSLYADNSLLFCEITGWSDYAMVQDNIDLVHAWFKEWLMELNISKCKFMVISRMHSKCCPPIQLLMDGVGLERVNEFKYLVCGCLTHWNGQGISTKLYEEHLGRLA